MALGIVLACTLSFLSIARVSLFHGSPKLSYRQSETFQATALVFLTQKGFPYGYTVLPINPTRQSDGSITFVPKIADVGRFSQLAGYYAPFVRSDAFHALLRRRTHASGIVNAQPVLDPVHGTSEPFVQVYGVATDPRDAIALANAASTTLSDYVLQQQVANGIPPSQRVEIETISRANQGVLAAGRKKTTPVIIFLTVLLTAVGLSFILENLRPRVRSVRTLDESEPAPAARRHA